MKRREEKEQTSLLWTVDFTEVDARVVGVSGNELLVEGSESGAGRAARTEAGREREREREREGVKREEDGRRTRKE